MTLFAHLIRGIPSEVRCMPLFACSNCAKTFNVVDSTGGQCPDCGAAVTAELPTNPPPRISDPTIDCDHNEIDDAKRLIEILAPAQSGDELGRLGPFRILKILGHGGMGVVYEAEDSNLKRKVAVKAMLPNVAGGKTAGQRFLREAQAMAAVEHPHIARIYHVDSDRGVAYLAMEFLKGEPLDRRLNRDGPLPIAEVLRIGREIAAGLAAAHERNLIHRDIKPANIWLESPKASVKILDFGLVRAQDGEGQLTHSDAIVGTPAYMAPEQARGAAVDQRTDLFSLGIVLYRMATGKMPFAGVDPMSTLFSIATDTPPSPRAHNNAIPATLDALIVKLLAKKPSQRFQTASDVGDALAAIEREPLAVGKVSPPSPKTNRSRPWIAIAGFAIVVGTAITAWRFLAAGPSPDQKIVEVVDREPVKKIDIVNPPIKPAVEPPVKPRKPKLPPATPVPAPGDPGRSPLDALDPTAIPEAELFDGQPDGLVAVIGERRQRLWMDPPSMSMRADGKWVAIGNRIWDVATRAPVDILTRQSTPFHRVVLAPDGRHVLYDSRYLDIQGEIKLVGELKITETIRGFTADGKWFVNGGGASRTTLRFWDLANLKAEPTFDLGPCHAFALSPDGKSAAVYDAQESRVWRLDLTVTPFRKTKGAPLVVSHPSKRPLAFVAPNRLVTVDRGAFFQLWDTEPDEFKELDKAKTWPEPDVLFAAGNGQDFIMNWHYDVVKWSVIGDRFHLKNALKEAAGEMGRNGKFVEAALAPDGNTLVTARESGAVQFWDMSGKVAKEIQPLPPQPCLVDGFPCRLIFSPAIAQVMSLDELGFAQLHRLDEPRPRRIPLPKALEKHEFICVTADGKTALMSDAKSPSAIVSIDGNGGVALRHPLTGHLKAGSFSRDGTRLAALTTANELQIWDFDVDGDPPRLHCEKKIDFLRNAVCAHVELTPDASTIIGGCHGGALFEIWTIGERDLVDVRTIDGVMPLTMPPLLSTDGKTLLRGGDYDKSELWDISKNPPSNLWATFPRGQRGLLAACFLADPNLCAMSWASGRVGIWDFAKKDWKWKTDLPGPAPRIAATHDGRYLITGNRNYGMYILRTPE